MSTVNGRPGVFQPSRVLLVRNGLDCSFNFRFLCFRFIIFILIPFNAQLFLKMLLKLLVLVSLSHFLINSEIISQWNHQFRSKYFFD